MRDSTSTTSRAMAGSVGVEASTCQTPCRLPCQGPCTRLAAFSFRPSLSEKGHTMLRNVSLGLVLALAACGSARSIQRTPTGGIIELQGDQNKAMEDANAQMAAHCGGPQNVQITLQG